jgi:hypothetical protein
MKVDGFTGWYIIAVKTLESRYTLSAKVFPTIATILGKGVDDIKKKLKLAPTIGGARLPVFAPAGGCHGI